MSQVTNYTVENAGGATVRADINNILLAVQSNNSGVTAPSLTYAGMLWLETPVSGNYTLKVRDKGNNHWLTVGIVTDPDDDDDMGVRLLQGAASKTHIKRSDGTVLLAEDGSNVATLTNVVLGTGSEPTSTPLLEMAASSTGIKRSSGTALLTEDASNVATLDQLTLGPGSGATNLKMAAVKLTADGRLERSDGTDILLEGSGVATLDNVSLGNSVVFPAGMIIQTEHDIYTGTEGFTTAVYQNSSLSLGITPKVTGSKMLIMTDVKASWDHDVSQTGMKITRHPAGGTEVDVKVGDAAGSRIQSNQHWYIAADAFSCIALTTMLLDDLTVTSGTEITYRVKISALNDNGTIYVNRGGGDWADGSHIGTNTSSLTVMEIAQ